MFKRFDLQRVYRNWPVLAGAFVAAHGAAGALSVSTQVEAFSLLLHGCITVAILASAFGLAINRRFTGIGIGLMVGASVLIITRQGFGAAGELLLPLDLQALEESQIAVVLAWMLCGFCFMQGSENGGAFIAATGMAIFGLMGTVNLNASLIAVFWVYLFGVVFMWGYERLLDRAPDEGESSPHRPTNWARWHLSSAALLVLVLMAVAFSVGTIVFHLSPNIYERMSGQVRTLTSHLPSPINFTEYENDFRVGTGPINLPDTLRFTVKTSNPALWRITAYDAYDGQGWQRTLTRQIPLIYEGGTRYRIPGRQLPEQGQPADVFRFVRGLPDHLPAASVPVQIQLSLSEKAAGAAELSAGEALLQTDAYGGLHLREEWFTDIIDTEDEDILTDTYAVIAEHPPTASEVLRGRGMEYSPFIARTYVEQVPLQAEKNLDTLVQKTVEGISDPYDRVTALREMIQERCLYTLQAPAVPRGEDAAAYFLLQSQRGACDLFATSLAVTARLAGIPARVVTGYQVGEYDAASQTVHVLDSDAHAWVEIYFPGVGWVPFDMQANEEYVGRSWLDLFRIGYPRLALKRLLIIAGQVVLALIFLYAAVSAFYDPSHLLSLLPRHRSESELEHVSRQYRDLYRAIARRAGCEAEPWMTPQEVIETSLAKVAAPTHLIERIERLNTQFYALRYDDDPSAQEITRVREGIASVQKRLRELKRDSS